MQVVIKAVRWKYYTMKSGQQAIKVRLTNYRKVEYIETGMSCLPENFDDEAGYPKPGHADFGALVKKIDDIKDEVDFQLKLAKRSGKTITLAELKKIIEGEPEREMNATAAPVEPAKKKIFQFYQEIIDRYEEAGNPGYADIFAANKATWKKLFDFEDKAFVDFTREDFAKISLYIDTLKAKTTKSLYIRTFYRVWNLAIEEGHCSKEHHPKNFIKYQPYARIKRKKRAAPLNFIDEVQKIKFPYESRLFRSQQYLIFSYYSRGINFNDLAKLKHEANVKGGYIRYTRSKNKREYDFQLHPKANEVVKIFERYPMQSSAGYVFPILDEMHDTPRKIDTRIESALKDFNEDLLEFEKMTNCPAHITSNVLRHSFATHLRKKRVDIQVIQEAMGHETEEQTQEYLGEIDDIVSDEIEKALL
jgi:integrase